MNLKDLAVEHADSNQTFRLSQATFEDIQSSIAAGEFNESTDQFGEELKAAEERDENRRAEEKRMRERDGFGRNSGRYFQLRGAQKTHDDCLSPAEKISKRLKERQRKGFSKLKSRFCHDPRVHSNSDRTNLLT